MVCSYCGIQDHNIGTCARKVADQRRELTEFTKRICTNCGQLGHMNRTCPTNIIRDHAKEEVFNEIKMIDPDIHREFMVQKIKGFIEAQTSDSLVDIMKKLNILPIET